MQDDEARTVTATGGADAAYGQESGLRVALVVNHAGRAESHLITPDTPLVVGRAPPATLCIEDRTLSREHARFLLTGGRLSVEDLGSKNGTFFGGRRVTRSELAVGDEVVLGSIVLRVQALGMKGESLEIETEEKLRQRVGEEVARAQQFRRPFALLFVRARPEGTALGAGQRDWSWLGALRARLRPVDRIALYGAGAVEVLLPETGSEETHRIAQALAAPLAGGGVQLLVGAASYPNAGSTAEALFQAARDAASRASPDRSFHSNPTATSPLTHEEENGAFIVGQATRPLLETIERVAASRIPVILHGETGTGKELLARMIHDRGPRKGQRVVRVNCGAIPKDLVESTLFGHERGAFTGALQQQKGVFEEADGGTVFLDEIGELPLSAQTALLRVLEVGSFSRVGSRREVEVNVRIVTATHRDLEAMAKEGAFRADLYYRLSGFVIDIPPLRERRDEIEPLARRFLRAFNEANGRRIEGFTPEVIALLTTYSWPGNVREVRNVIERAAVVARGALIGPDDLPARVCAVAERPEEGRASDAGRSMSPAPISAAPESQPHASASARKEGAVRGIVQQYEAKILQDILEAAGWNRAEAARQLGLPVRTLSYRMKVLGVRKPNAL